MSVRFWVAASCALLCAVGAYAQTATLLNDTNTTSDVSFSSEPQGLVTSNGIGYFFASSSPNLEGLWRTNGTAAGTYLVRDHLSGRHLTASGGKLFFIGDDGVYGSELWTSDGTTGGTVLVKDIQSGPIDGVPPNRGLFAADGIAYFVGGHFSLGLTLWRSDGTEAGTVPLLAVDAQLPSSLGVLDSADGVTFFYANDGINGSELWKTDGTPAGTVLVRDIRPGPEGIYPQGVALYDGSLYFFADDGVNGLELWKSDGTMLGTSLVVDLNPGAEGSWSSDYFSRLLVGNDFYFAADNGDSSGVGLWKSDGTAVGTERILAGVNPQNLAVAGNLVYFVVHEGFDAPSVLWKTDGTTAGTAPIREFVDARLFPVSLGGALYFAAWDADQGYQLWKSNGTLASTVLVKQINTGGSSDPTDPVVLRTNAFVSGTLVFSANDGVRGAELWKSNGSTAGTVLVKDIGVEPGSSNPSGLVTNGADLYFTAARNTGERTQWKSDGTPQGTVPANPLPPAPRAPGFFAFNDGVSGLELWKTDGTVAGTRLVKDIHPGPDGSVTASLDGVMSGGTFFFPANDGVNGTELWKSDGTEAGTVLVRNIHPAQGVGSLPNTLIDFNGILIFRAASGITTSELWRSDGTAAGTMLIEQQLPPRFLQPTIANRVLFYLTWDPRSGYRLWRTDGTVGGAIQLQGPTLLFEQQPQLINVNGALLFTRQREVGTDFDSLRQGILWKTDGTIAGTVQVKSFDPVPNTEVTISPFIEYNGALYFLAAHPSGRMDLWKTDATEEGTVPIGNLPAPAISVHAILGSYAGTLFLDVQEGTGDGSAHHFARTQGTAQTTTIDSQAFSGIEGLVGSGPNIFFVGTTEETGTELWTLPLQPAISTSGVVDAAGYSPTLAPGSLASLFGVELAGETTSASSFPLPTTLAGAKVQVNGIDAPLLFVSPTQINFQVPYETPLGSGVSVVASLNGQQSLSEPTAVTEFAPAMFVNPTTGEPIVQHHADGALITAQNPAKPGDTLILYVTGIGGLDNPPETGAAVTDSLLSMATTTPTVLVGGVQATVLFAGLAPGFAGLGQINIELPQSMPQGNPLPLTIRFGDSESTPVELQF